MAYVLLSHLVIEGHFSCKKRATFINHWNITLVEIRCNIIVTILRESCYVYNSGINLAQSTKHTDGTFIKKNSISGAFSNT